METALRVMSPPGLLSLSLFLEITGFPTPLTASLHKGNISLSLYRDLKDMVGLVKSMARCIQLNRNSHNSQQVCPGSFYPFSNMSNMKICDASAKEWKKY